MIGVDVLRDYCLAKKAVSESFPFDEDTLVFKVMGKMYALISLDRFEHGEGMINLKCDPEYAIELRENYSCIKPGYHMSKVHWNSVYVQTGDLSFQFIKELIDHSYDKIVESLPKKVQAELAAM